MFFACSARCVQGSVPVRSEAVPGVVKLLPA